MLSFRYLALFPMLLAWSTGQAHQINGTVRQPNGRPIQGSVQINCPELGVSLKTSISDRGGFSLFVRPRGRCVLSVGQATFPVYSSAKPVRYDLILENSVLVRR